MNCQPAEKQCKTEEFRLGLSGVEEVHYMGNIVTYSNNWVWIILPLVVMPGVMPGATSSVLAPICNALVLSSHLLLVRVHGRFLNGSLKFQD